MSKSVGYCCLLFCLLLFIGRPPRSSIVVDCCCFSLLSISYSSTLYSIIWLCITFPRNTRSSLAYLPNTFYYYMADIVFRNCPVLDVPLLRTCYLCLSSVWLVDVKMLKPKMFTASTKNLKIVSVIMIPIITMRKKHNMT